MNLVDYQRHILAHIVNGNRYDSLCFSDVFKRLPKDDAEGEDFVTAADQLIKDGMMRGEHSSEGYEDPALFDVELTRYGRQQMADKR